MGLLSRIPRKYKIHLVIENFTYISAFAHKGLQDNYWSGKLPDIINDYSLETLLSCIAI